MLLFKVFRVGLRKITRIPLSWVRKKLKGNIKAGAFKLGNRFPGFHFLSLLVCNAGKRSSGAFP